MLARNFAEASLRESESRYRSVIAAMQEGILLFATDGAIRSCNAAGERILGVSEDQIRGRKPLDLRWRAIHEDGTMFSREGYPAAVTLRTGKPCSNVIMGLRKADRSLAWISVNTEPLFDTGGAQPSGVVASFVDITARKRTELALRDSEHRWRSLTETLPQLIWSCGADGAADYVSAQWRDFAGVPETDLLGWRWAKLLHPDAPTPT